MSAVQSQINAPVDSDQDRYWLPGPPPRRRRKELNTEQVPEAHTSQTVQLCVPIRRINLWSSENRCSKTLAPYFREQKTLNIKAQATKELYLFHGCASEISPALLASFSRHGPSIHYSRQQSYFSRTPAVYWTDSLDFAFAWCVFSETGSWTPTISPESFECLIYVSKVNKDALHDSAKCYTIPEPVNDEAEQRLVQWCKQNMVRSSRFERLAPPGSERKDWSLIGTRIPRHTMDSLTRVEFPDLPALGKTPIFNIRMYAACDKHSSESLAAAGLEILHITSRPEDIDRARL